MLPSENLLQVHDYTTLFAYPVLSTTLGNAISV